MTNSQKIEVQEILKYLSTLKPEELETAFEARWKPFIQSLDSEEDRVSAFQIFYEWQITQMNSLAKHISTIPLPGVQNSSESKKAVA